MRVRFALINVLGLSLIAAAWWAGWGEILLQADRVHSAPVIAVCLDIGLLCCWFRRWDSAEWIADKLPILGLIGTVAGVLLAFHDHPNLTADNGAAAAEIGRSLVANLIAITSYGWLSLVIRICQR